METDTLVFTIFLIFTGAAVLATIALYARQAMLVAYIVLGILAGPWGFGFVNDPKLISDMSNIGILFLLFLLGLDMPVGKFIRLVGETTLVTGISSLLFAFLGIGVAMLFGFGLMEQLLIGASLMFSSTIVGLKLLPTTILHHKRTGEIIISILLLQDLIAILILLALQVKGGAELETGRMLLLLIALPALYGLAYILEKYMIKRLIMRFDTIQEYVFMLAIGWCLGFAELSGVMGLSHEIGAFIAGVALATSPVALFVADSLRPLRDFFLVIFFFSLGAGFDLGILEAVIWPAVLLAGLVLLIKPWIFRFLLQRAGESGERAGEVGWRLGQVSEFSLLIALLAIELEVIGSRAAYLIQATTILTFIASSYLIVLRYPTPIAVSDKLRRN